MLYTDSISLVAEDLGHSDTFGPLMLVVERGGGKALRRTAGVQTPLRESEIVKQLEAPGDAETLRARATVLDVTVKSHSRVMRSRSNWSMPRASRSTSLCRIG